ncbi:hypothetical protein EXIGLDRAFT_726804 [Exidia glandulosa HHB12029]|uniref:Uncharacterized protein n=1 Tax=Exidia glandulosa HHB12029 TaxID=1314781 RepID=A0A165M8M4_EXIGL|nr:hypothetical protein EXIGLDRAFT_726804 [Exidia glandulosa HHB12029]
MSGHRRALLFFHHIYSSKKRAFIRAESLALSVTGVCKVGRPGVLAVQGPDASVQEYVGKVKVPQEHHGFAQITERSLLRSDFDGRAARSTRTS